MAFDEDGKASTKVRETRKTIEISLYPSSDGENGGFEEIREVSKSFQKSVPCRLGWHRVFDCSCSRNMKATSKADSVGGQPSNAAARRAPGTKKTNSKKQTSSDRQQRSRERNRIHARKTRQRKKEQMQNLQGRADLLKKEQLQLKQVINEKTTASILVAQFALPAPSGAGDEAKEDPRVEELLRRPAEEIPDASRVPELPALILPGQHASKKIKAAPLTLTINDLPKDGIDYDLLGKDRSKCTPEELDRIRRERNRMHAKRTRDRKRLFTEQMSVICRQLEEENQLLVSHLSKIDPEYVFTPLVPPSEEQCQSSSSSAHSTPSLACTPSPKILPALAPLDGISNVSANPSSPGGSHGQICTLLEAAVAFDNDKATAKKSMASKKRPSSSLVVERSAHSTQLVSDVLSSVARNLVALSDDESLHSSGEGGDGTSSSQSNKRQRVANNNGLPSSPSVVVSIAPATAAVGC